MRRPRMRVRTLMIVVAVVALASAGWMLYVRWTRLAAIYRYTAWAYGTNVRSELQRLAKRKRELAEFRAAGKIDYKERGLIELGIEQARARIAANANLVQLYEHAAAHPWEEPPVIAETGETTAEEAPIPKRLGAGPQPPAPPWPYDAPNPHVAPRIDDP